MAKKKEAKKVELKEVNRTTLGDGTVVITMEDGSVKILPAPILLTAEQASELFSSNEDEDEEEEETEEEEEEESDDEESDDEEEEDDEDDDEDEEEEEDLTPEALVEMDFEELEDVCDDKDLDTDPDDFEEKDIEKLRNAIAKELGIKLPKKEAKAKSKKKK